MAHWLRYRNATQAYQFCYDAENSSYETCRKEGARLLELPDVARAIAERKSLATEPGAADVAWLFHRFLEMGTADPRELIGLKVGCCRYCHGVDHGYQWREREYMEALDQAERRANRQGLGDPQVPLPDPAGGFGFNATLPPVPECPQCHGEGLERFVPRDTDNLSPQALLLFGGVKVKKDGYEIIMADRGKALELAGRIMGAFKDNVAFTGAIAHLHNVGELRKLDPQEASKQYRDFIAGKLAVK